MCGYILCDTRHILRLISEITHLCSVLASGFLPDLSLLLVIWLFSHFFLCPALKNNKKKSAAWDIRA